MTKFLVRLIAVLEMLGGVAGVGLVFWQILAASDDDPAITLAPVSAPEPSQLARSSCPTN